MAHNEGGQFYLALHEVFFDKKGKPSYYTENPVTLISDDKPGMDFLSGAIDRASKGDVYWHGEKFPELYTEGDHLVQSSPPSMSVIKSFFDPNLSDEENTAIIMRNLKGHLTPHIIKKFLNKMKVKKPQ